MRNDLCWLRPLFFQPNLKYLPVRITVSMIEYCRGFCGVFARNTGSWYFKNFPNITRHLATRDVIMFTGRNFCNFLVNFEVSLTLFNINTPRNIKHQEWYFSWRLLYHKIIHKKGGKISSWQWRNLLFMPL